MPLNGAPPSSPLACPQLGRRTCLMLDAHMQRFSFSPLGALRWKRDLSEYAALAARMRAPAARLHLEDMQVGGWVGEAGWGEGQFGLLSCSCC